MKLKTVLLPFATLVLCANAFAAPPSNASLERWLDTQNYDRDVEKNMIDSFNVAFQPYADNAVAQAPADKQEQVAKAVDRYRENVLRGFITPELKRKLRQTLLESAKTTFTQEEIDGMTAFYSTPVGKSVLAKTPLFINKTMNKLMVGRPSEINDVTKRYLPEFEKEMQQIMCGGKNPHKNCTKPQQGKKAGSR